MPNTLEKSWYTTICFTNTHRTRLCFDYFIEYGDAREISAHALVYWQDSPDDILHTRYLLPNGAQVELNHYFKNGRYLKGHLQLMTVPYEDHLGVWGHFVYGQRLDQLGHFQGMMIEVEINAPVEPVEPVEPPLDPDPPVAPPQDIVVGSGKSGDLFPYIYMRRWPGIPQEGYENYFIQYDGTVYSPPQASPPAAPPADSLYTQLSGLRPQPDGREQMETRAVDFIDGKAPTAGRFASSVDELSGYMRDFPRVVFPRVDQLIRADPDILLPDLVRAIANCLAADEQQLRDYIGSAGYRAEKERVWQSYFALVIVLGYRTDLLQDLVRILIIANLLEVGLADGALLSPPQGGRDLAQATIILPPAVFPLPPPAASPPAAPAGWIEPYAIGDLQMVRQRLAGYEPGEVAHIENVLSGERKEITRRTLDSRQESLSREEMRESSLANESTGQDNNLLSETLQTVADTTVRANYDNLSVKYGPPTIFTLNGAWSTQTQPTPQGAPAREAQVQFARDILNKTVNRIAQRVSEKRVLTHRREFEKTETTVLDNTGQDHNLRGIYRWLNKIYLIQVVNYGTRMMIEFMLRDPAARFIDSESAFKGLSADRPCPPAKWVSSFEDITRDNYATLGARYGVSDFIPPPLEERIVTATLQGQEVKQVAVPEGYIATEAAITCSVPQDAAAEFEGVVGTHSFALSGGSFTIDGKPPATATSPYAASVAMRNEDATVPLAIAGGAPSSPPAPPDVYVVTVEIKCVPTGQTETAWRIRTYDAITRGYRAQKETYYERTARDKRARAISPLAARKIEQQELKQGCTRLLLERYWQLAGDGSRPFADKVPSQFGVNEPRYIQFFDQAFEWEEMAYGFIVDLKSDGGDPDWQDLSEYAGDDGLFTTFLQADMARVLVPVRPERTLATLYYLSCGMLWVGADALAPVVEDDSAVAYDAKLAGGPRRSPPRQQGGEWPIVLPTSMHVLQENGELPIFSDSPGAGLAVRPAPAPAEPATGEDC